MFGNLFADKSCFSVQANCSVGGWTGMGQQRQCPVGWWWDGGDIVGAGRRNLAASLKKGETTPLKISCTTPPPPPKKGRGGGVVINYKQPFKFPGPKASQAKICLGDSNNIVVTFSWQQTVQSNATQIWDKPTRTHFDTNTIEPFSPSQKWLKPHIFADSWGIEKGLFSNAIALTRKPKTYRLQ